MLYSMTGFGQAQVSDGRFVARVEVRSVNNRGLKVMPHVRDSLHGAEPRLEQIVKGKLSRGTVYLTLELDDLSGESGYEIDLGAVKGYLNNLAPLKNELGYGGEVRLESLLSLPGCIRRTTDDAHLLAAAWNTIEAAAHQALDGLIEMRRKEGRLTCEEIRASAQCMAQLLDEIESKSPRAVHAYREKLSARISELMQGTKVPEDVLAREIAIFADRVDICEEVSRLRSHLEQVLEGLSGLPAGQVGLPEPCACVTGRKLEFLVQEMLRESNTLAAKAADAELVHLAVQVKLEVERIREQALNVE